MFSFFSINKYTHIETYEQTHNTEWNDGLVECVGGWGTLLLLLSRNVSSTKKVILYCNRDHATLYVLVAIQSKRNSNWMGGGHTREGDAGRVRCGTGETTKI